MPVLLLEPGWLLWRSKTSSLDCGGRFHRTVLIRRHSGARSGQTLYHSSFGIKGDGFDCLLARYVILLTKMIGRKELVKEPAC